MSKFILKLKLREDITSPSPIVSDSPNSNNGDSRFPVNDLYVPSILYHLNIDWANLSDNLAINASSNNLLELETLLNKFIYSDKNDGMIKNFGIKVKNLYDLGLNSINQIKDSDLVVDYYGFGFSRYDLKRLDVDAFHPYFGNSRDPIKIADLKISPQISGGDDVNVTVTVYDHFRNEMLYSLISESGTSLSSENIQDIDDIGILEHIFEKTLAHDFYTTNLVSIYHSNSNSNTVSDNESSSGSNHLRYTVALLYYILTNIDDFGERYVDYLFNMYVQTNQYITFLKSYTYFLMDVRETCNREKFQYVCIIIVKILQYRYSQIKDGEYLFNILKDKLDLNRYGDELYWSIILDRVNYLNNGDGRVSLINITVDNIFSNTDFNQYYYTLMVYLHTKYMQMPSSENGNTSRFLNHYKQTENYSYLDIIQYFSEMCDHVQNSNSKSMKRRFESMIKRYYLKRGCISINRYGLVIDTI